MYSIESNPEKQVNARKELKYDKAGNICSETLKSLKSYRNLQEGS